MRSIFTGKKLGQVQALAELIDTNPFTERRGQLEEQILGEKFTIANAAWSSNSDNPNLTPIKELTSSVLFEMREQLQQCPKPSRSDIKIYREIGISHLFNSVSDTLYYKLNDGWDGSGQVECYDNFAATFKEIFHTSFFPKELLMAVEHIFATCFQTSRAFNSIYENIFGSSKAIIALRSAVWESIFTHKMKRYRESRYRMMKDVTTLITGPSGTGKELVARAIAFSRYIPFSGRKKEFNEPFKNLFHPIHLSALSPTLIESELFGHCKGAFTGALHDRIGRLEACSANGTVFLDEIGEITESIQVKMLRVLQDRSFQKLGENSDRTFAGKIIAATNRDLNREIELGNFRSDFYYRLCSDIITTPALQEQAEDKEQLYKLVLFLAKRVAGEEEAARLSRETIQVIEKSLGKNYNWPGNVRELEQCIRNVFIRGDYKPFRRQGGWLQQINEATLSADELLNLYCRHVYEKTGSYVAAANLTGLDRRTIKSRVEKA